MKKITQQNLILSLFENIVRSNIYIFIIFRFLVNKYFTKFIYETDFKILYYLKKIKFFKKSSIIDIGANDGISIKSIRNFVNNKIYSFEPDPSNFKKINLLKSKFKKLFVFQLGLSNKKKKNIPLFQAYFKKFHISPFDSLKKKDVLKHLNESLFIKSINQLITIKKSYINLNKLDNFNFKTSFIKIDIQGHEYECVQGSLKTIKKNKPILMIEYDEKIISKINQKLSHIGYKKYFFISNKKSLYLHKKQNVFNIFFIHNSIIKIIERKLKVEKIVNH